MKISNTSIGKNKPVFVVAEISTNHGQDLTRAIKLIKEAKKCGADAVKFQAFDPDVITIQSDSRHFRIKHPEWGGQTLYDLYKKAYTPWEWFKKIKKAAKKEGMIFLASAFDEKAVDFLESLDIHAHKIASFELVDIPLIEYAAAKRKPLILSTGMGTKKEIKDAVNGAKTAGSKDIILMKCVSNYPAKPESMHLNTIPDMREIFKLPVGISDHSLGFGASIAAVALGAVVVEKHFTLSRRIKTPDSFFSMEPDEFKVLVENIRIVEKAMGKASYGVTSSERDNRIFRRSLFAVNDIKKGTTLTKENIRSIRPAHGLPPVFMKKVINKKAKCFIKKGTPLKIEHLSKGGK